MDSDPGTSKRFFGVSCKRKLDFDEDQNKPNKKSNEDGNNRNDKNEGKDNNDNNNKDKIKDGDKSNEDKGPVSWNGFHFSPSDTKGYPFQPEFWKACHDGLLPETDAVDLIPEPLITVDKYSPSTSAKTGVTPDTVTEYLRSNPLLPNVVSTESTVFPGPNVVSAESTDSTSPAPIDIPQFSAHTPLSARLDLKQCDTPPIGQIMDRGVMTSFSNFVPARLPGFKSVHKIAQYQRDRDVNVEPPVLQNVQIQRNEDSYKTSTLNACVLDIVSTSGCTELPLDRRFRPTVPTSPNLHESIKCCRFQKKRELTRSYLGLRHMKTRYYCPSRSRRHRLQFRSNIDLKQKTREGHEIVYAFSIQVVRPIRSGRHHDLVYNLIRQRQQTVPVNMRTNFDPELYYLETGVMKTHSNIERSKDKGIQRKINGRKSDLSAVHSDSDDDGLEDAFYTRHRDLKRKCLNHGKGFEATGTTKDETTAPDPPTTRSEVYFDNDSSLDGANPAIMPVPLPNVGQAHRMAGFGKLLGLWQWMQQRRPEVPLRYPVSISHPCFVWKHAPYRRDATELRVLGLHERPANNSLRSKYLADRNNLEPYNTFITQFPSMSVMEEMLGDESITRHWSYSFDGEQRMRTQVVLDDHKFSLRSHRSLDTPRSLERANVLWHNFNELPPSCPYTPKKKAQIEVRDMKNKERVEDTKNPENAPVFGPQRSRSAPNRLLTTEITSPIKEAFLEEQRRIIDDGWRNTTKGNVWVSLYQTYRLALYIRARTARMS